MIKAKWKHSPEGWKGIGIGNKQEEACRVLAISFYIWFIPMQVILYLLNTHPDLSLFYTCVLFHRSLNCLKNGPKMLDASPQAAEDICLCPSSVVRASLGTWDPCGPGSLWTTVSHSRPWDTNNSWGWAGLVSLGVNPGFISPRGKDCESVTDLFKIKPDCFQAYFWSGKIESAINLIFWGSSVCYHVVMCYAPCIHLGIFLFLSSALLQISVRCVHKQHTGNDPHWVWATEQK